MKPSQLLDRLAQSVLIYDGAMGTQIQGASLSADAFTLTSDSAYPAAVREAAKKSGDRLLDGCNEFLNFSRPQTIEEIHCRYLEAGADLIETNTFGCTSIVLAEYDIPELVYETAKAAGAIARRAADRYSTPDRPRFVVGAIGPGTKLVSLGQTTFDELERTYRDAFVGLIETGVDALLLETLQDLLMVKAGIVSAYRAMAETEIHLPIFVQVTMEQTGTMLLGSEMGAALNMVESFPLVAGFGLNCATGPVEMAPHIQFLAQNSSRPICVQPNAGLPVMEHGKAVYKLSPAELAHSHERFVEEFGAAMIGGCCGTTPEYTKEIAARLAGRAHTADVHWRRVAPLFPGFDFRLNTPERAEAIVQKGCSSLYQFQPYEQDSSYLIVGEKTNANGSAAFRKMLAEENWDGLVELARELEAEGSHVLDVCTAFVGRDEARDIDILVAALNQHVTVPLMVDSTETPVIETALKRIAGKPLINSINFEDGGKKVRDVLELCRKYGAGVVALTIDEDGMAKTLEKKLQIAERLLASCREYDLPDYDVFIDFLTFTLGSGDEEFRGAGRETIEAIRELKKRHPRVNTILGVSNISFGLKPAARTILNSAFLHECREAGLTSAIVHFSKILPDNRIEPEVWKIAQDLVFDRREFAKA